MYVFRTYIYYDSHLLDTFFDGGGDVNMALIACAVVMRWTWSSSFTTSTTDVVRVGVKNHVLINCNGLKQDGGTHLVQYDLPSPYLDWVSFKYCFYTKKHTQHYSRLALNYSSNNQPSFKLSQYVVLNTVIDLKQKQFSMNI